MDTVNVPIPYELYGELSGLLSDGETVTSFVQKSVEAEIKARSMSAIGRVDAEFMSTLKALHVEGRYVSSAPGKNYAPAVFEAFRGKGPITRAGYKAAMHRLLASGKISEEQIGPPSKRRRRLVATS